MSEPVFEQINTDYEVIPTIDEQKHLDKYGDIDPSLVDKIASSSERNKVIVEQYMANRDHYGKTLMFALNIHHCITLKEDFDKLGVRCDFVYSGKPDNEKTIERFRQSKFGEKDALEVLININILTEGSDVPDIQTVFLTRPTTSEVLLMQMIGRGLRGVGACGTEKSYIVDFNDKWDTFQKWLTPKFVLGGDAGTYSESVEYKQVAKHFIPYSLIVDIYNSIAYDYTGKPFFNTVTP